VFVKVCGTTSEEDALLAVAMGADALGFVFAPSPRQVAAAVVADIVKRLPPEVITVGVFRNEAPTRVVEIVTATGLKGAQLHGHETSTEARWIRARVPLTIRAFAAGDPAVRQALDHKADAVLIDAPSPGSGQVFDWSLAAEVPGGTRLLLSGGLTPENVADAIVQVRPWGVDVVSGVERAPGHKDPRKLRAFVAAARSVPELERDGDSPGNDPFDWQEDLLR